MRRTGPPRSRISSVGVAIASLATLLVSCSEEAPSALNPAGPGAGRIAGLWWVLFWISVVVIVAVTVLLVAAVRRRGSSDLEIDRSKPRLGEPFIVVAGVVIPALILTGTFVYAMVQTNELATGGDEADLTITVEAQNWWWEVRYPNGAVTANEIHIPAGRPVELRLVTADVIHSFWVPELNVKKDHVPGMDNRMWIMADRPGRYRGQCAEFCGLQHAKMAFYVEADPPAEFDEWMAAQARPAAEPATPLARRGRDVFAASSCAGCHTIRGVTPVADLGPDLTHMASRETLAAGALTLTRDALATFVHNAQIDKPGATMPPTELAPDQVAAVVEYLMGLD